MNQKSTMYTLRSVENKLRRIKNKKSILITGTFDILHVGHLHFLQKTKKYGDVLVVGVSNDKYVREIKGSHRPIIPAKQRAEMVAALKPVDFVFVTDGDKKSAIVKKLKPNVAIFNIYGLDKETVTKRRETVKNLKKVLPKTKFIFLKTGIKDLSSTTIGKKIAWSTK
ncbi:adenylyltransferase/cytidyltransferase family protein [Patescibacteria group bacterium]|nr:adenylyltransferase/cytidyltransferase family protein [Patescibacteria group bacterium]